MTVGLTIIGVGMLLMQRIAPDMPYSALWWNLTMLGVGMGLVMTPMTAAVMSAVPRERAGMASATSNASREVGGVFGIALLGAIVTHWFSKDLASSLSSLPLPARGQGADRCAGRATAAARRRGASPPGVDAARLHDVVDAAFVSGMHVAFWVSAGILLTGRRDRRCVRAPRRARAGDRPPEGSGGLRAGGGGRQRVSVDGAGPRRSPPGLRAGVLVMRRERRPTCERRATPRDRRRPRRDPSR